jgi:hypothetical protein
MYAISLEAKVHIAVTYVMNHMDATLKMEEGKTEESLGLGDGHPYHLTPYGASTDVFESDSVMMKDDRSLWDYTDQGNFTQYEQAQVTNLTA